MPFAGILTVEWHCRSDSPLVSYVYTLNRKLVEEFISQIRCGGLTVNDNVVQLGCEWWSMGSVLEYYLFLVYYCWFIIQDNQNYITKENIFIHECVFVIKSKATIIFHTTGNFFYFLFRKISYKFILVWKIIVAFYFITDHIYRVFPDE